MRIHPEHHDQRRIAKLAQRVGLTARETTDLFASLPAEPQPEDRGRIADLKTHLASLESGTKLCEIGTSP